MASYEDFDGSEGAHERADGLPLLEIYAPLLRTGTNETIAIGEYYQQAPWFGTQLQQARAATWALVGTTTAAMIGVLFLIVSRGSATITSQRAQLGQRIAEANLLATQNDSLRVAADRARLDANEANEQLLARIGSDLHDGPIQMLSLLTLRLSADVDSTGSSEDGESANRATSIARDVLSELRTISAGLILPEITRIDLRGALQLAIFRHEDITGIKVVTQLRNLPKQAPLALKTCAYRVVQEALSNAYKHAGDVRTEVKAGVTGEHLQLVITDAGPGLDVEDRVVGGHDKLGLAGIRNRVSALKGRVEVKSRPQGGVLLTVLLPLAP